MLSLLFTICIIWFVGKFFIFGLKASWGIMKLLCTVIFFPVILIGMVVGGLMEELQRQKVTVIKEINAILRLTDFGKLKGKIWKILYDINNSPQMKARIVMPGKYILKLLQN